MPDLHHKECGGEDYYENSKPCALSVSIHSHETVNSDFGNYPAKVVQTDDHVNQEWNHNFEHHLQRVAVLAQQYPNQLVCENRVLIKFTQIAVKGPAISKPANFNDLHLNRHNFLFGIVLQMLCEKRFEPLTLAFLLLFVIF